MLLLICALIPLFLGGALPLLRIRNRTARMAYALFVACVTSAFVLFLSITGAGGQAFELFRITDDYALALRLDGAGKVYLCLAAVLWPLAVLYAAEYMRHEPREGNFFAWYLIAYAAAILLSAADNLFTLYVFYELLTLCTVPLVWHKRDEESTKAALVYMLYLIGGAMLGFVAVVGFGSYYHTGDFSKGPIAQANPSLWLALLGFLGFGVKAAVLPLCRWLPKASVAPTPVTALLHAVAVVNAGVFAVLRVLYYAAPSISDGAQCAMLILSAATIVYGAVMAVREQQVKRRLAWSTVSNLSYMLLGLSLLSPEGMAAGMAHMVFHGLCKIILFFCAGSVLVQTGRTQVRQMHGLGRKMPFTFGAFTLAGLSLTGVPPLPGFVSKYALVTAAFQEGGLWQIVGAVALMISTVLTVMYIFTVVFPAFFMAYCPAEGEEEPRDPGLCMKIALLALSALLIGASVFAGDIMGYLQTVAGGLR